MQVSLSFVKATYSSYVQIPVDVSYCHKTFQALRSSVAFKLVLALGIQDT